MWTFPGLGQALAFALLISVSILLGAMFVVWAWARIFQERITSGDCPLPKGLFAFTISVCVLPAGLVLWFFLSKRLEPWQSEILLSVLVASGVSLSRVCFVSARGASGPGADAVLIGSRALFVLSAIQVIGFIGAPWKFLE